MIRRKALLILMICLIICFGLMYYNINVEKKITKVKDRFNTSTCYKRDNKKKNISCRYSDVLKEIYNSKNFNIKSINLMGNDDKFFNIEIEYNKDIKSLYCEIQNFVKKQNFYRINKLNFNKNKNLIKMCMEFYK
ncbi:hypothetical protein ACFIJ5_11145 [Haloimpatiens sp. FM7330]|uniref:hypothetical protein n=1 Tax=Haloimpatiens sp. FM7330 TaxID=3298610 RepID=UPI003626BF00